MVKTRQQSSISTYQRAFEHGTSVNGPKTRINGDGNRFVIWRHLRRIVETESPRALFKGLGPNLVGVAPSRAIYFCVYSTVKDLCNNSYPTADTPLVHMSAAASAGFVSCTLTNPVWFIKTRMQLDQRYCRIFIFK